MGCLFVIVLGCLSAVMVHVVGYKVWVLIVLGVLWLAALLVSAVAGHRGFGGGGNTDLMIVLAGASIAVAIVVPNFNSQRSCNLAKAALRMVADAENEYFWKQKKFTNDIHALNLSQKPDISIVILKGDQQSFVATASNTSCMSNNGSPQVFTWDSARGGLQ